MSLENAHGIWQLIPSNPTTADYVSQGDDHIRMLKRAILNTFPNVKGPVVVSHTVLNDIPERLNDKIEALILASMPRGACIVWDIVNNPTIPPGWSLCNGAIVEGYGQVPDMRDKFIKGWNGINNGGTSGGSSSAETSNAGAHMHTTTTGAHALTISELPKINFATKGSFASGGYAGGNNVFFRIHPSDSYTDTDIIADVGNNQPHSHPGGETSPAPDHKHTVNNIDPVHYKAVWIVKTTSFVLP